jgi:prevent-host-death family protein
MKSVGIFQAKSRLSELVSQVERGERVLLTRNGRPVAEIVPVSSDKKKAEAAMKWILSRRWKLGNLSVKELVNEGRRS